ncbi:DEAD/DEAH box helicase family protein [Streptococcus parauberis]|uniref:DEAD/DEAH box helicase n=1 Tax=Streptococcus parauberis TaxID=1348 RepID=UPI0021A3353E|nr:DEAD/DEAH box helicase family protein [Streptococcus parauberis]UWM87213.1 DEAD/DEAH box helicase family protein [Streptococcus parauberis]
MQLLPYQEQAVDTLVDLFFFSPNETTVFYAPTGSGKTVMLINLMDRIVEDNPHPYDYCFIWLTPGSGELEEQSWEKSKSFARTIKSVNLDDSLNTGFKKNTATFLNWEKVKNDKQIALRVGDTKNLDEIILDAKNQNLHFVLIIDEEHRDQTEKSQRIINKFNADKIIRASATPKSSSPLYDNVQVNDEDVISQGMIVRNVELNPDGIDGDVVDDMVQYFLDFADDKRRLIKSEYQKLDVDLNPLVLIQFPDEKKNNKNERNQLINEVKEYLIGIGQNENQIATWLANEKVNIKDIEKSNSAINYLLMKQAVSTGWDAPRAKILVKFRLNSDPNFTLQTIGRIRRMPQQKHYENIILDNAYIYSNDQKYISEVNKKGEGVFIATYELKENIDDFQLLSVKPNNRTGLTNSEIVVLLRKHLKNRYGITEQNGKKNQEILTSYGYKFGNLIHQGLTRSDKVERDILENTFQTYSISMPVSLRGNRLDLLNAQQKIQKYLYRDSPSDVNHILLELFSNRSEEPTKRFLSLKPAEFMAFIINNYQLIRDFAKSADANNLFNKQLSLEYGINHKELDLVPFYPQKIEMYQTKKINQILFLKKIYTKDMEQIIG